MRRLGLDLVLWRDASGTARCAEAACPHRGADLGRGRVVGGEIECPYHGFRYAGDGRCTLMPCEGRAARVPAAMRLRLHPVREAHGFLWLWYGPEAEAARPLPWVSGAPGDGPRTATRTFTWDARFSRVMEGMLDVHHVPFVHRRYFPRAWARLDPFEVEADGGVVRLRGALRREAARPGSGLAFEAALAFPGTVHFRFPQLRGLKGLVVVCTPVDGESTWIAERYDIEVPLIGRLVGAFGIVTDWLLILPDDRRVQRSSRPRTGTLATNQLVHADAAIAAWHRPRAAALSAAGRPPPDA